MIPMAVPRRLIHELGGVGVISIAVVAIAILFLLLVLKPLEKHSRALEAQLMSSAERHGAREATLIRNATPAAKIEAFYGYLRSEKKTTDWLGELHGAAKAAGLDLHTADYRMTPTGTRIDRYEIRIPLRANYAQVRAFIDGALAAIPMLSLDEVKFKRERAHDNLVESELHFTLHLVNS
jgi:hypothetical protein